MNELQLSRVQRLAIEIRDNFNQRVAWRFRESPPRSVLNITHERVPYGIRVNANLMSATGMQARLQKRVRSVMRFGA